MPGESVPTFANPAKKQVFAWSEVEKHNSETDAWLVIRGKVYDMTPYVRKHPGGFMILLGAGRDATELFESHHPLRIVNGPILDPYYIGEVDNSGKSGVSVYPNRSQFYPTLKKRVEEYFTKNKISPVDSPFMYFKTIVSLSLFFSLYYLSYFANLSSCASTVCAMLFGWSMANIGMNIMHDGNHGGYSKSPVINKLMGATVDLVGASSYMWRQIHQIGHHVHTNVDEKDPDIMTKTPHFRRIKASQKFFNFYRFQHLYLPFMYAGLGIQLNMRDYVSLLSFKYNGVRFAPMTWDEKALFAICKPLYLVYMFVIPVQYIGWSQTLINFFAANAVLGLVLVLMFQVNHVVEKCDFFNIDKKGQVTRDWAEMQALGSANFGATSWFWNLVSGGLNNQIEHHLFPYICHVHYPKLSPIVEQTCKEFGLRYNNYNNFFSAVASHFRLLYKMGQKGYALDVKLD